MNRIANRSWIVLVLALLLMGGTLFFVVEFVNNAEEWVFFPGSPQIYSGTKPADGLILDRSGLVILDMAGSDTYAEEPLVRKSMLHWTGDREGNISGTLAKFYREDLVAYDLVNGAYHYGQVPGEVKLTLSAQVQTVALEALGDRKGTVAVYNYRTGELLCAVSTPTFDPDKVPDIAGDDTGAYDGVYLNRFIQSTYTPGSIFKLVTTAAALETIPDILDQEFSCSGSVTVGGRAVTCERAHGTQSLADALANSCNCAYAGIALQVGADKLQQYAEAFGVTSSLSFDGFETASGNFDVTEADDHELAWAGIGQYTDLVNPCQYLSFLGAIAGDGNGVLPHVVDNVTVGDTVTYRASTEKTGRILSVSTAETLQQLMANNVTAKYGADNFPAGLTVCAKSGTAQKDSGLSDGLFAGFVADEEYPLAFIVVVQEGGYGSQVCVPIISQVLSACVEVLDSE